MRGEIIELKQGLGRVRLEDGREMSFDIGACAGNVALVGSPVTVQLGPSRLGGVRVERVDVLPTWEEVHLPALYLGSGRFHPVTDVALGPLTGEFGSAYILKAKRNIGSGSFEPGSFSVDPTRSASEEERAKLISQFSAAVAEALESWNDPDGCHCQNHYDSLQRDLATVDRLAVDHAHWPDVHRWAIRPA